MIVLCDLECILRVGHGGGCRSKVGRWTAETCGAWMRNNREPCARQPGHGREHRSRYALDNASRAHASWSVLEVA